MGGDAVDFGEARLHTGVSAAQVAEIAAGCGSKAGSDNGGHTTREDVVCSGSQYQMNSRSPTASWAHCEPGILAAVCRRFGSRCQRRRCRWRYSLDRAVYDDRLEAVQLLLSAGAIRLSKAATACLHCIWRQSMATRRLPVIGTAQSRAL